VSVGDHLGAWMSQFGTIRSRHKFACFAEVLCGVQPGKLADQASRRRAGLRDEAVFAADPLGAARTRELTDEGRRGNFRPASLSQTFQYGPGSAGQKASAGELRHAGKKAGPMVPRHVSSHSWMKRQAAPGARGDRISTGSCPRGAIRQGADFRGRGARRRRQVQARRPPQ